MNPSAIEDRNNTIPVLQSFCCQPVINKSHSVLESIGLDLSYDACIMITNACCLFSSIFGIGGAVYQLKPKQLQRRMLPRELNAFLRQNFIICRLALADFLVSIGLFVRSAVFLGLVAAGKYPQPDLNGTQGCATRIFCLGTVVWIEYLYICTFLWTFCFAYEIYRILHNQESIQKTYQFLSWGLSGIVFTIGFLPLVVPSGIQCEKGLNNLLPHYLLSEYLPLLFAMIANPVLYHLSSPALLAQIKKSRGQFTDDERKLFHRLRRRHFRITGVFWLCWFPNLLQGPLMLIVSFYRDAYPIIIMLQILKAFLNPLQALFNSLAYTNYIGWRKDSDIFAHNIDGSISDSSYRRLNDEMSHSFSSETDPLISHSNR